jgi:ribose transport system substrate-binding protein
MKRYMKIALFAALAVVLLVTFTVAGCKTTADGTAAKKLLKPEDVTIGFSLWTMEFTFFQNVEKGVKDACAKYGFKYTMLDQKSDATQMV